MTLLRPTALCRLDEGLLERIRRGDDLRGVVLLAIGTILVGAGAYGVAFGIWRAPEQALYSAIKLPALLLSVALCTVGLGGMLAMLLRSRLSLGQTAVCMLLSFAVTSAVLGALAPVSIAFDLLVPPADPARLAASLPVGRALLLLHTTVLAGAGVTGVLRLRLLLARLGLDHSVARRLLVSWISAQFLVGSQLCWLFRPFFGEPDVRVRFFAEHALRGSFFDAVARLMGSTFGPLAPVVFALFATASAATLVNMLRVTPSEVSVDVGSAGLAVKGATRRVVTWREIALVRAEGSRVTIDLRADETLGRGTLRVVCESGEAAAELARRIEEARGRLEYGAFRTAG
jgi:hypothetical protein